MNGSIKSRRQTLLWKSKTHRVLIPHSTPHARVLHIALLFFTFTSFTNVLFSPQNQTLAAKRRINRNPSPLYQNRQCTKQGEGLTRKNLHPHFTDYQANYAAGEGSEGFFRIITGNARVRARKAQTKVRLRRDSRWRSGKQSDPFHREC